MPETQKVIKMQGKLGNLIKNETIGNLAGFASTEMARGDLMSVIESQINAGMTDLHFPDLRHVAADLVSGTSSKVFKPAATAAIVGYFMQMIPFAKIKRLGATLQKVGVNVAVGSGAASVVVHTTTAHSPEAAPRGGRQVFLKDIPERRHQNLW